MVTHLNKKLLYKNINIYIFFLSLEIRSYIILSMCFQWVLQLAIQFIVSNIVYNNMLYLQWQNNGEEVYNIGAMPSSPTEIKISNMPLITYF